MLCGGRPCRPPSALPERLRVLLLNERDPLHPKAGGAEVHVAEIAKRLARHDIDVTQLA